MQWNFLWPGSWHVPAKLLFCKMHYMQFVLKNCFPWTMTFLHLFFLPPSDWVNSLDSHWVFILLGTCIILGSSWEVQGEIEGQKLFSNYFSASCTCLPLFWQQPPILSGAINVTKHLLLTAVVRQAVKTNSVDQDSGTDFLFLSQ